MSTRHLTGAALAIAVAATAATVAGGSGASAAPGGNAALKAAEQSAAASTGDDLGLPADQSLTVRSVLTDPDGTRHVRYDRTVDGLPVVGGDLVVAKSANGTVKSSHWNRGKGVAPASTKATVTKAAASGTAAKSAGYRVDSSAAALVVYASEGTPRLAWQVTTTGTRASQTPSRLKTWVDARTGKVIDSAETIEEGTGNTQYSGAVTLNTVGSPTFRLRDSVGNFTTDLNGATSGTGTEFTDLAPADDVWGNFATSSRQTAAADAQWGAQQTYAFYNTTLGRAGIWNTGVGARSRVHYGNAYVNAFWDGTQMTYGDGASNLRPLTAIDVAGHEMSHGVTENSAGLNYRGESGGLNEATSDIFGTAVEFFSAPSSTDVGDYLIGEKININGNGTPLRYMDKPSKDGRSADCWSRTVGRLDVHYSSGPLNHWYYLVSEGSTPKTINGVSYNSPTCGAPAMTGVGHAVAEKVWYRTLTTKLTSSSGYAAARNGAIASAKELYGRNSANCLAVQNAFNAIAVPAGTQTCAN
ncbi:MAG TPA: M4 family metallopeptidase [Ornithinibacter sp.]|nr:M4 family metallopeptidase [Ornithinibacter sp.]